MKVDQMRVAVVGAGPIGIEATLYARTAGLSVTLYERGQIGEHLTRWGHVRMFTPFGMNSTPLGLRTLLQERPNRSLPAETDPLSGREFRDAYLIPLAESETILESVCTQQTVLHIGRSTHETEPGPFRLLVRAGNGQERIDTADVILDCAGTYSTPNWLGDGNIPAVGEASARPQIAYGLEDVLGERKAHYAGKSIVLVGDGYSAATTICALATLAESNPSTWVTWLTRGQRGQPLPRNPADPLKERDRLAARANSLATRCDGNLEFHPRTVLDEVVSHGADKGFRVSGRTSGKPVTWEVERVIASVGFRASLAMLSGLRVDDPVGESITREPGYYILGVKSFGRTGGFTLRHGFEQIRQVFARITNNPQLDLYRPRRVA